MMNEKGDRKYINVASSKTTMVVMSFDIAFLLDAKMIWIEFNDTSVVVDPIGFKEAFNKLNTMAKK